MKQTNDTQVLIVDITPAEREAAKRIARSCGMTFKGWLGQLVKRELRENSELVPSVQSNHGYISHYKD